MKKKLERGLALLLAVLIVMSAGMLTGDGLLRATDDDQAAAPESTPASQIQNVILDPADGEGEGTEPDEAAPPAEADNAAGKAEGTEPAEAAASTDGETGSTDAGADAKQDETAGPSVVSWYQPSRTIKVEERVELDSQLRDAALSWEVRGESIAMVDKGSAAPGRMSIVGVAAGKAELIASYMDGEQPTRLIWVITVEENAPTQPGEGEATQPGEDEAAQPGGGEATQPGGGEAAQPGGGEATQPGEGESEETAPITESRSLTLEIGYEEWLDTALEEGTAVAWERSSDNVTVVAEGGTKLKIKGSKAGEATVIAKYIIDGQEASICWLITVPELENTNVQGGSDWLGGLLGGLGGIGGVGTLATYADGGTVYIYVDGTADLKVNKSNKVDFYSSESWTISPEGIVEFTSGDNKSINRTIKGTQAGATTVKFKRYSSWNWTTITTTWNVYVTGKGISLSSSAITLDECQTTTLTANLQIYNSDSKTVNWNSDNTSVATVSNGKVTAVAGGTCTITATNSYGNKATCTVTVNPLTLSKSASKLVVGSTDTISSNQTVTWSTNNADVAIVSDGVITAVGPGNCVVTATNAYGAKRTVNVSVISTNSVSIAPATITIKEGETYQFNAVISPDISGYKHDGTWSVDDYKIYAHDENGGYYTTTIASVDENGLLTAIRAGTSFVRYRTSDGKEAVAELTVTRNYATETTWPAYFYVMKPDYKDHEGEEGAHKWWYMGKGTVTLSDPSKNMVDGDFYDYNDFANISIDPSLFVDIEWNGKTYTYDPDGGEGTYGAEIMRVRITKSATDNDMDGDGVVTTLYDDWCYHIDYYLQTNEDVTVGFKVRYPGSNGNWTNAPGYPVAIPENGSIEESEKPAMAATATDDKGFMYQWGGWYTDEACTVEATEDNFKNISDHIVFYGQYVPEAPAGSYEAVYDGQSHGLSVSVPDGAVVEYQPAAGGAWSTTAPTARNVGDPGCGSYNVRVTYPELANYVRTYTGLRLNILPRPVTLSSAAGSKDYDGTPLKNSRVTVTAGSFASGEGLSNYNIATGSQTVVGSSANSFDYTKYLQNVKLTNYDITKAEGALTVNGRKDADKREITITAGSAAAVYDGQPHSVTGFASSSQFSFTAYNGASYSVSGLSVSTAATDVRLVNGSAAAYEVYVKGTAVIRDAEGNDVSSQFKVTLKSGALTITQRQVTLSSGNASKLKDGLPLSNPTVTVGGDGFVGNQGLANATLTGNVYTLTSGYTTIGPEKASAPNSFTYTLNENTNKDNYKITAVYGSLSITEPNITKLTLTIPDIHKIYNGSSQTAEIAASQGFPVTCDGKSLTVTGITGSASGKDYSAAGYPLNLNITGLKVYEGSTEVSDSYTVTVNPVKLIIDKAKVTVTSASQSKAYDGEELITDVKQISAVGFCGTDGASYENAAAALRYPGSTEARFTYTLNSGVDADNYSITPVYGTLTVTDRGTDKDPLYTVSVSAEAAESDYDGTVQSFAAAVADNSAKGVEVTASNGLSYYVTGLSATAAATAADAGTYTDAVTVNRSAARVLDADGKDVTAQFKLVTQAADLVIKPLQVTVTSGSDARPYNGTPLTVADYEITAGAFIEGHVKEIRTIGSQTLPGRSANTIAVTFNEGVNKANYELDLQPGMLEVTALNKNKINILLNGASVETDYNGRPHALPGLASVYANAAASTDYSIDLASGTLTLSVNGQPFTVSGISVTADSTVCVNAGTYNFYINTLNALVFDGSGNNVTSQFNVSATNARLVIKPIELTLTSGSNSWSFDGSSHSEPTVTGDEAILAADRSSLSFANFASVTLPGEAVENSFDIVWADAAKGANYSITPAYGSLQVSFDAAKPVALSLTANSGSDTYNAYPQTVSGFAGLSGAASFAQLDENIYSFVIGDNGYIMEGISASGSGTEAGEHPVNVDLTELAISLGGVDVTGYFKVTPVEGTLKIGKRPVILSSGDVSCMYDGTAISTDLTGITAEGFISDGTVEHYAVYSSPASLSIPGQINAAFSYELMGGASEANYEVQLKPGKLTVTDRDIDKLIQISLTPNTLPNLVYDGSEKSVSGYTVSVFDPIDNQTHSYGSSSIDQSAYFEYNGVLYAIYGISASASRTDAGTTAIELSGTPVISSGGVVLTEQFFVNMESAELVIAKRPVTIKSADRSQTFNGKALRTEAKDISDYLTTDDTQPGFVGGDGADYKLLGEQLIPGSSPAVFEHMPKGKTLAQWLTGDDATNYDNYIITVSFGTLTVGDVDDGSKLSLTVRPQSLKVSEYDGQPHSVSGALELVDASGRVIYTGAAPVFTWNGVSYSIQGLSVNPNGATRTDAGSNELVLSGTPAVYMQQDGKLLRLSQTDLISQFTVNLGKGSIEIGRRAVVVSSGNLSKAYDKAPLTATANDITATGFVNGDEAKLSLVPTGSQTYVGSSANSFDLSFNDGTAPVITAEGKQYRNYLIKSVFGTLTVTDRGTDGPIDSRQVIQKSHAAGVYGPGDKVSFTITVTNIYADKQTITITEQSGISFTGATVFTEVEPGQAVRTTAEYVITEADILAGSFTNTACASFSGGSSFKAEDRVELEQAKGHLTVAKEVTSTPANGSSYAEGETVSYKITLTNDGNLTVTGVKLTDKLTGESWDIGDMAPGASTYRTTEYVITAADLYEGSVINRATAEGVSPDPEEPKPQVEPGEITVETVKAAPGLLVTQQVKGNPSQVELGQELEYTVTVTNKGNVALSDVTVTDALTGKTYNKDDYPRLEALKPGESLTIGFTHTVTEADILKGSIDDEVAVSGTDPKGSAITDRAETTVSTQAKNSHLTVNKAVVSQPSSGSAYRAGDTVTYNITVVNDGNLTVTDIRLSDPLTAGSWTIGTLEPGESFTQSTSYLVKYADLVGSIVNVATATGTSPDKDAPQAVVTPGKVTVPTLVASPAIYVEQKPVGEPSNVTTGDVLEYTLTVTNNGNVALSDVTVVDSLTGKTYSKSEYPQLEALDVGEAVSLSLSYTVTEADVLQGSVEGSAEASGKAPDGETVRAAASSSVGTEKAAGKLTVTKKVTSTPSNGSEYLSGETVTYEITVTNSGNLTVKNVVLTDELTGDSWDIGDMAPGAHETRSTSYVIKDTDLYLGTVTNKATASGDNTDPTEPEPQVSPDEVVVVTEKAEPAIELTQTYDTEPDGVKPGEEIKYTVTVTNTGNVALSDATVTDALTGETIDKSRYPGLEALEPGESVELELSYTVTEDDVIRGEIESKTDAGATDPKGEKISDSDRRLISTAAANSHLTIDKKAISTPANGVDYLVGEVVKYEITVTNDGNLTVYDVIVSDELTGDSWTVAVMAPGASESFEASYTVTVRDAVRRSITNVATATAKGTDPTVPTDPDKPAAPIPAVTPGEELVPVKVSRVLTVLYEYEDGTTAAPHHFARYHPGQHFETVWSPDIPGYTPDTLFVSCGQGGMPDHDLLLVVTYKAKPVEPTPPDEPPKGTLVDDVEIVEITEEEIPLAELDHDHSRCILHLILLLAALITFVVYLFDRNKRSRKIEELKRQLAG